MYNNEKKKKNVFADILRERKQKQKEQGRYEKEGGIEIRQNLTITENGIKVYKKQLWLTGRNVHFHVQRIR